MSDPSYGPALRLFNRLPRGPWYAASEHDLSGNELLGAILDVTQPDAQVRDFATASGWRASLLGLGFIQSRLLVDGRIEYRKNPSPPEPDTRPWMEIKNEELARLAKEEQARMRQEADQREAMARLHRQPAEAAFAAQFHAAFKEAGGVTRQELQELIDAAVEAALARHLAAESR